MPSNPHILHIPNHQTTKPTYLRPRFKKMWNCNHFHNKTKQTHRRTQPTQPKRIYGVHTIISTMFIRFFAAWEGYNGPHIHTYWNWLKNPKEYTEYKPSFLLWLSGFSPRGKVITVRIYILTEIDYNWRELVELSINNPTSKHDFITNAIW